MRQKYVQKGSKRILLIPDGYMHALWNCPPANKFCHRTYRNYITPYSASLRKLSLWTKKKKKIKKKVLPSSGVFDSWARILAVSKNQFMDIQILWSPIVSSITSWDRDSTSLYGVHYCACGASCPDMSVTGVSGFWHGWENAVAKGWNVLQQGQ